MAGKYSAPLKRQLHAALLTIAAASLALAGPSFLASCHRSSRAAASPNGASLAKPSPLPPPAVASALASPQPQSAGVKPPPAAPQLAPASPPPPQPRPAAPLSASMRAFGLKAPSVPRIAEDYSLGPLQSYRPAEGDESAVFTLARSFLDQLGAGKIDRKLLLPGARDALAVILAAAAERPAAAEKAAPKSEAGPPSAYRLGEIELQGGEASMRIRLPGSPGSGRREGLLSLRKIEDSWFVEALALEAPATGALAFNPDTSARQR